MIKKNTNITERYATKFMSSLYHFGVTVNVSPHHHKMYACVYVCVYACMCVCHTNGLLLMINSNILIFLLYTCTHMYIHTCFKLVQVYLSNKHSAIKLLCQGLCALQFWYILSNCPTKRLQWFITLPIMWILKI